MVNKDFHMVRNAVSFEIAANNNMAIAYTDCRLFADVFR